MANMVMLNFNHFGGNGVGVSVDLDGGEEVFWKHVDDGFIVGAEVRVRVRVRVRVGDGFDKRDRVGGSWRRGHWPNRRFWRPY